jgi:mRNA interferase MazF
LASLAGDDLLLCQITSQPNPDAIHLNQKDFTVGSLLRDSYIKPLKLFTADKAIIIRKAGHVNSNILNLTIESIVNRLKD